MADRDRIISEINKYLNIAANPEQNGLQVEGRREVNKIVFGVSANIALFKKAKSAEADMIIVHHGLLWGAPVKLTGIFGSRVSFLIKNDINLAGYHLPLDLHPVIGNNAQLAQKLGLKNVKPFGDYHNVLIGFRGEFKPAVSLSKIRALLGGECLDYGPSKLSSAAIVSGGAHNMLRQDVDAKVDLYITGSRDEYVTEMCREAGVNFIAMGHYNSETLGIRALMKYAAQKFKVKTEFIDIPNPF